MVYIKKSTIKERIKTIMNIEEKKKKIGFILSSRNDYDKSNQKFYQYLYNEYLNTDDDEVETEFNFYLKN
jgi:hypothetical protein|tara:strand:- start:157 stop:366 length:210 start_codon:yes stop_codon:yes gene_type:complete